MERLAKGDIIEGAVSDFGMSGEGVVKIESYPVFVPFAICGEKVRARINFAKRDFAFADLIEVLEPSKHRIKPRCPYFTRCGGCDLQHIHSSLQGEIKRQQVARVLKKNAGLDVNVPMPISGKHWGYRNKLSLPFGRVGSSGKIVLGFYEKRTHQIVPMKFCLLHGEWAEKLIAIVSEWANENALSVYDEKTGKGLLRHMVARFITTLSIIFSVNGDSIPNLDRLVKRLDSAFSHYTIYISPQKEKNNVILGAVAHLAYGKEIPQNLGAISTVVSPLSFLQVNDEMRERLYVDVAKLLGDCDEITELYAGVGLLTAQLATRMKEVRITAVEIIEDAVRDAKTLMCQQGVSDRVSVICADATNYMREEFPLSSANGMRRVVLVDPPRKGCSIEVIEAIADSDCERVLYISCNPATLSRDLKILLEAGYKIASIQSYDMFPETMHVETVVQLSK